MRRSLYSTGEETNPVLSVHSQSRVRRPLWLSKQLCTCTQVCHFTLPGDTNISLSHRNVQPAPMMLLRCPWHPTTHSRGLTKPSSALPTSTLDTFSQEVTIRVSTSNSTPRQGLNTSESPTSVQRHTSPSFLSQPSHLSRHHNNASNSHMAFRIDPSSPAKQHRAVHPGAVSLLGPLSI